MEGCQHSPRYLVWSPGGLNDVPLVLTKFAELRVKIGESRRIGILANAPTRRTLQAGTEVASEDCVVQRHLPKTARSGQLLERIREHVTVHHHGASANCIAAATTAPPSTSFWRDDSGSHGSTHPFMTNWVKSSMRTSALLSPIFAATSRLTVDFPTPDGPVTMRIGARAARITPSLPNHDHLRGR